MVYQHTVGNFNFSFPDLKTVLAKASPEKSGDQMAGLAANSEQERIAAKLVLADIPMKLFLNEEIIPSETDAISRLIEETHDAKSFQSISHLTVGGFRDWLLAYETDGFKIKEISPGLTPEMVAAVSKIMANQDLILVASKIRIITKFRNTIGLKGHFSTRLQPNNATDDAKGIMASTIDGLLYGVGDAV
ncbi:MAG: ethanolamine ammonia-lyase large subunit, partial [Algoriphagus sp.]